MTTSATALLAKTQGQHGFWLTNHADIIEPQVSSLISIHGEATALALINTTDSNASKDLYKVIEHVRDSVEAAEHNPKHEDDYFNAGGFFAHWQQYSEAEKLEFISQALEVAL